MTQSVSIREDGVISVIDPEVMDSVAAEQIAEAIEQYAKDLRGEGKPVLILVDARPLKQDSADARGAMVDRLNNMDFNRMAIYGTRPLQTKALNLVFRATRLFKNEPLLDRLKLFGNRQTAERWLKDYPR